MLELQLEIFAEDDVFFVLQLEYLCVGGLGWLLGA